MIILTAPFFDSSGYAVASRSILKLLDRMGVNTRVTPYTNWAGLGVKLTQSDFDLINKNLLISGKMEETDTLLLYSMQKTVAGGVPVRFNKAFTAVHTMFETDRIPEDWRPNLNMANWVLVPSKWGVDTFRSCGISNAEYMPFWIDTDEFHPHVPKLINDIPQFKFMFIGDIFPRKNFMGVFNSFMSRFQDNKDVVLIVKMNFSARDKLKGFLAEIKTMRKNMKFPKIYFYNDVIPNQSIPGFINSCDCLLAPSCGEGFGLPQLYAMACEKPIITTNWSSCSDYATKDNSLLVDYTIGPVPYDIVKQDKNFYGHEWANPSTEHLGLLMNWVFTNQSELKTIGTKARETVLEKYSYQPVADLMNIFLKEKGIS